MRPQTRSHAFPRIPAPPHTPKALPLPTGQSQSVLARSVCGSCAPRAAPAAFTSGMIELNFTRIDVGAVTSEHGDHLHPGHIKLLEAAREMGDALVVGLNSDESVRTLKGAGRPVIPEQERAEVLANLECVDAVVVFNELTPQKTVAALLPDILVKGGDWPGNQIVGREEVEAAGGKVVLIDVVEGHSTTKILRKIRA